MPTLTIDGKKITVAEGTNVLEAARQHGIEIPHFCYHPKLSVPGNCRMCLVQVEKMGKPQISCNTAAAEGMVVHTKTPEVQKLQQANLEFILINHPIDCPVCDQAGECKLQEYYMDYTLTQSEFEEDKVKKPKKVDLGPRVMLDAERCILCSRCIRFCDEISKTGELCFVNRGDQSTLTTFPGKQLDNAYSLNTVDICPVGALTSKPFRFKKRVWFLRSVPSLCTGCSNGCNIYVDHDDGKVWRYQTRENEAVNECWTCDEGRLSYGFINENRITRPMVRKEDRLDFSTVPEAVEEIVAALKQMAPEEAVLVGSAQESNENNAALKKLAEVLKIQELQYSALEVDNPSQDDFLIKADKNPNRGGVEHLGFQPFVGRTGLKVVIVLGGLGKSHLARLKEEEPSLLVVLASNHNETVEMADVVLPTATFVEQVGTFTNHQNRIQKFEKALDCQGVTRTAREWLSEIGNGLGHTNAIPGESELLNNYFGISISSLGPSGTVLEEKK